ncbi:MAG TPA: transporter substrate-binding domain-containing protein [Pseudoalteromonas prydzensis]|uniref:Transporter substrate-binding domain-containing protein n=2 Tax=root TaxID=1 RepID=A0A7V1CYN3_9GAMM|nr:transporter substrate-binding domain-containing protein [Pseudoalteromonas prydzensis]HEA16425.1 transporter substrate-binding domain-containing protein [Pseudoalteromonas prydzensis]
MIKLVVCYCLLFSYSLFAQCNTTVKIAVINNSPPYSYLQDNRYEGIDVDIARKVLQAVGVCFEFVEMPNVERAKRYLAMGRINMMMGIQYTDAQNRSAIYSLSYRDNVQRLFINKAEFLKKHTLIELLKLEPLILFDTGQYAGPEIDYLRSEPSFRDNFQSVATMSQRLVMLSREHGDISIENELAGQYFIREQKLSTILMHPYLVQRDPVFFIFSRKNPILTEEQRQQLDLLLLAETEKITTEIE